MSPNKQFFVLFDPATRRARYILRFAAPPEEGAVECEDVRIETGDGATLEVGMVCSPSVLQWRWADEQEVGAHTYSNKGSCVATLHFGSQRLQAAVGTPRPSPLSGSGTPALALFHARRDPSEPYNVTVKVRAEGLTRDHRLRIDSGSGQFFWIDWGMAGQENSLTIVYAKLGTYTIGADLVDADGFRILTLGETSVEIADEEPEQTFTPPAEVERIAAEILADPEVPVPPDPSEPWNLFRYARPAFGWTRCYRTPGGYVSRSIGGGSYVAIRREVATNGQIWYQTGLYDWIPATAVTIVTPSNLRGVQLDGGSPPPTQPPPQPPPPQPPPASTEKKGVVIAGVLNVRARPGVSSSNPPIDTLRYGAKVTVYEERTVAGAKWYRVGANRWVHGGYIRLQGPASDSEPIQEPLPTLPDGEQPVGAPAPVVRPRRVDLPVGWVVAPSLNARRAPGDNAAVVRKLAHNEMVSILEETKIGNALWYRIDRDQWVTGAWIGVARPKPRPKSIKANERWVGVSLKEQTVIAYEGDKPVYAALAATGTAGAPTVQGVFRTWWRLTSRRMAGPGYYLEEVTWTCYFHGAYALHTAYWHDAFGRPRSHGCVNLSPYDAWWIFQWSAPGGANAPAVYSYWA